MNTATQLLEQALEALIESRDDVATAIHLVPSYKADLERRVAEATEQLNKHESTIKDIEAYLAKQQVEQEPVAWMQKYWSPDCGDLFDFHIDDEMTFRDRTEYTALYTAPPSRKILSDEQDRALCEALCNTASDEYFSARPQLESDVNRRIFYAGHRKAWITKDSAIEAHRGIK